MLEHPNIIFDHADLLKAVVALRASSKRVVFTNGCYDIIHPGHVDLISRARKLGDALIVALNADASVARLGKGADRPLNPLSVRAFVMAHIAGVDLVTAFDEDTPLELIRIIEPDVLVKGGDWKPEAIVGRDIVEARGGKVYSLPLINGFSTTALVEKIRKSLLSG
jgi:rfaE bifunctional protein nucleotidyltransferase chain/domain